MLYSSVVDKDEVRILCIEIDDLSIKITANIAVFKAKLQFVLIINRFEHLKNFAIIMHLKYDSMMPQVTPYFKFDANSIPYNFSVSLFLNIEYSLNVLIFDHLNQLYINNIEIWFI